MSYALLGDDIVICDSAVAHSYKSLMMDLGLELSPSKGLESPNGVFEFCKRLIGPTHEYSPIGMRGISVALKSPAYLTSLFVDLAGKGFEFSNDALELLFSSPPRFIIKTKMERERVLWTLLGVFGFFKSGAQIGPGKTLDSSVSEQTLRNFLTLLNATSRSIAKKSIATSSSAALEFLSKLSGSYQEEAVHHFHGNYALSQISPSTLDLYLGKGPKVSV